MVNKERLIKISQALDMEAIDVVELFEMGGYTIEEALVEDILAGSYEGTLSYEALEMFLNGLIDFNRGQKEGQEKRPATMVEDLRSINNVVLKKMKIAFSLSSQDLLTLINKGGVDISKEKLSCLFRKEGHKSYKYCRDVYVTGFLKALKARNML